jgi:hypothetical protein
LAELPRDVSPKLPKGRSIVPIVALFYGAMVSVALAVAWWRPGHLLYTVAERPMWWPRSAAVAWSLSPMLGVAVGLVLVLLSRWAVRRFPWARYLEGAFRERLGPLRPAETFALALASALGEELLFRGVLTPMLGALAASMVFAALHVGPNPRFLPWTAMAFGVGLLFAQLAQLTGDLGGPIAAHFVINWLNLRHIVRTD